jgi:hypothetical protein
VPEELCLRKNTAPWDRVWRLAVVAAIALGLPSVVHTAYGLMGGGVVAGFWLVAGLTGY